MKQKGFLMGITTLMLAVVALMTGCDQMNRKDVVPQGKDKVTVSTEMYYLEADGTLTPLSGDLRAVTGDTNKGTVTGDGVYDYNASVTLTVTAKGNYLLHKLYERSGKGGFTDAAGRVDQKSKALTFNVTSDMQFVAIFSDQSGPAVLGYQNLKLNNQAADYTKKFDGKSAISHNFLAVGEQIKAILDPSGNPVRWEMSNAQFKAWEATASSASWLTRSVDTSTGKVSISAQPYIAKASARTATFKVGKDGTTPSHGKNAWRMITITQDSYYEGTDGSETDVTNPADDQFVFGDGTSASIPATLSTSLPATGGQKDLTTLHKTLNTKVYLKVPVYVNGVKRPKSEWVRKELTVIYNNPAHSWLTKIGSVVKAGVNNTSSNRSTTVKVDFKLGGVTVKSSTITISQNKRQYNVDVELQ